MKLDLDILRSRHVLHGMFLGYLLGSPSLSLTSQVNGPSNGLKTVRPGQKSRPECETAALSVRWAPHCRPRLTAQEAASAHHPAQPTLLCP